MSVVDEEPVTAADLDELYWAATPTGPSRSRALHAQASCHHLERASNNRSAPITHLPHGSLCADCTPSWLTLDHVKAEHLPDYSLPEDVPPEADAKSDADSGTDEHCAYVKVNGEYCEHDPIPGAEKCPRHLGEDSPSKDDITVDEDADRLRYDSLSGFQRDILHALYACQTASDDDTATASDIIERLNHHPAYDGSHATRQRFYSTSNRLNNRGWLTTTDAPGDSRYQQYALTDTARDVLEQTFDHLTALMQSDNESQKELLKASGGWLASEATGHETRLKHEHTGTHSADPSSGTDHTEAD